MQPKCTHCGNLQCKHGKPSVHVLDVSGGKVHQHHFLCTAAAEALGILQPKTLNLTLDAQMLEQLSQTLGGASTAGKQKRATTGSCPGCGLTLAKFRERGRLGCPRCYEVFHEQLVPLLEKVHDASNHVGRFPGRTGRCERTPLLLADLRDTMQAAIEQERYEEAARLRDEIRRLEERQARSRQRGTGKGAGTRPGPGVV